MKFWKILSRLLDEMFPDWQDKFISYKHLKKQLNLILPLSESSESLVNDGNNKPNKRERGSDDEAGSGDKGKEVMVRAMDDFVKLLKVEINKFNGFFMDQEEDYIIRLKVPSFAYFPVFIFLGAILNDLSWLLHFFSLRCLFMVFKYR